MRKFAIFIEPTGLLLEEVIARKKDIECYFADVPYLSHPPHSTLVFTHLKDVDQAVIHLLKLCKIKNKIDVHSRKKIIFYDDILAGGGHTLAYQLDLSDDLLELQLGCAESIRSTIEHSIDELPSGLNVSPFKESFEKYSFPFVGKHWIPHVTVASIRVERDHVLINEFLSKKINFSFEIDKISLWEIDGDKHKRIESFDLLKK